MLKFPKHSSLLSHRNLTKEDTYPSILLLKKTLHNIQQIHVNLFYFLNEKDSLQTKIHIPVRCGRLVDSAHIFSAGTVIHSIWKGILNITLMESTKIKIKEVVNLF